MSHLPECWLTEGKFDALCLCDRLRACEQRLLDAAREAVAALQVGVLTTGTLLLKREDTLAAIDALRDRHEPPPLPPSQGVSTTPMWPLRKER